MYRQIFALLLYCISLISLLNFNVCVFGDEQAVPASGDFSDAVRQSVRLAGPSIVNIQLWGASETKTDLQTASRLSGFVVASGAEGLAVTTLFGFDPLPGAILITDAQGRRSAAKVVARDFLHKLVLLKANLAPPQSSAVPPTELMRPGQWVVACGRVFPAWTGAKSSEQKFDVNLSVGILSATGRIGGLAIQTDAAVSPNNYGGPLLNLRGAALGILTPLSSEDDSAMAGFEWYDSGVGFAIPMETVEKLLSRWKQGGDLYPGWAGFGVESKNAAMTTPISAGPPEGSPAQKAGLLKGDQIVAIDGQKIATMAQGIRILNGKFAGETIEVTLKRTKTNESSESGAGKESGADKTLELTLNITLEKRPEAPKPDRKQSFIKPQTKPEKDGSDTPNAAPNDSPNAAPNQSENLKGRDNG